MALITDWLGAEIEVASSVGGVLAVANPWENLVRTGIAPWPPSELPQKLYQSRQERHFSGLAYVRVVLALIGIESRPMETASVWLWRRVPHPDTLVPGGPEIDFGLQSDTVFLLGEAKWLSHVGAGRGVNRDKDQVALRREFCEKLGRRLLQPCSQFVVLGVSPTGGIVPTVDTEVAGVRISLRDTTWQAVVSLDAHPLTREVRADLAWKRVNSRVG